MSRGIERECKFEVINLLEQGVRAKDISEKLNLPLSTVCEWKQQLDRKKRQQNTVANNEYKRPLSVDAIVQATEIKISNLVSPYITPDVTDVQWFSVEDSIRKILTKMSDDVIKKYIGDR